MSEPEETVDKTVQYNIRVPRSMRDAVDERREALGLSRDEWTRRALDWALKQPVGTRVSGTRTPRQVRRLG